MPLLGFGLSPIVGYFAALGWVVLMDEDCAELTRRLVEHDRDPSTAILWPEARQRLRDRFGNG